MLAFIYFYEMISLGVMTPYEVVFRGGASVDFEKVLATFLVQLPVGRASCLDIQFLLVATLVFVSLGEFLHPVGNDYVHGVDQFVRTCVSWRRYVQRYCFPFVYVLCKGHWRSLLHAVWDAVAELWVRAPFFTSASCIWSGRTVLQHFVAWFVS